jgi:hypothetical protein
MSSLAPEDSSTPFAELLRELGVEPVLIGALAALKYRADPRLTTDVDFLIPPTPDLAEALRQRGYEVREHAEPGEPPHLLYVRGHGHRIDLLTIETDYQRSAYERAIDGVLTVEDVVIHKLLAWRPRDRDDVASILDAGHDLDEGYIVHWASEWGVEERWQLALRRRGGR